MTVTGGQQEPHAPKRRRRRRTGAANPDSDTPTVCRTRRPFVTLRRWEWKAASLQGDGMDGIGIFHGQAILAHLTPDEARKMADKLHDKADQIERET